MVQKHDQIAARLIQSFRMVCWFGRVDPACLITPCSPNPPIGVLVLVVEIEGRIRDNEFSCAVANVLRAVAMLSSSHPTAPPTNVYHLFRCMKKVREGMGVDQSDVAQARVGLILARSGPVGASARID